MLERGGGGTFACLAREGLDKEPERKGSTNSPGEDASAVAVAYKTGQVSN